MYYYNIYTTQTASAESIGQDQPQVLIGMCIQDTIMHASDADEPPLQSSIQTIQQPAVTLDTQATATNSYDGSNADGNDSDDSVDSDTEARINMSNMSINSTASMHVSTSAATSPVRTLDATTNAAAVWSVSDCYEWMRHIGKGGDMIDIATLTELYKVTAKVYTYILCKLQTCISCALMSTYDVVACMP
jgi:hypothetical protein